MKVTITLENGNTSELEIDDKQLAQLGFSKPEVKGQWVPEVGQEYWRVEGWGEVENYDYQNYDADKHALATGNIFATKEAAEKHVAYLKAVQVIKQDADFFRPDWTDVGQKKWCGAYDHDEDKFYTWAYGGCQVAGAVCFESRKKLKASFKAHEAEWKVYCGVES